MLAPALAYSVGATKKGGVPVRVESRKSKKVVVIDNAEGDLKALLKDLQGALGTGGVLRDGTVEVQGEQHLERVTQFLLESGCIVGASKQVQRRPSVFGTGGGGGGGGGQLS